METKELKKILECEVSKDVKKRGIDLREKNIDAFKNIDRTGLLRNSKERMMLLYTTLENEKIYIIYPGKETVNKNEKKIRPWDFRPKIERADGTWMDDLLFIDIWGDIEQLHKSLSDEEMSVLASIFYRAFLMKDTQEIEQECVLYDVDVTLEEKKRSITLKRGGTEKIKWQKIILNQCVIEKLNDMFSKIREIRGISFEAYLYYNDLLCQNEDCKYFYRATKVDVDEKTKKKGKWYKDGVGRENTYLTHLDIIAYYLLEDIDLKYVVNKFMYNKGVGPLDEIYVSDLTKNIISFVEE